MQDNNPDGIDLIRSVKRSDLKDLRNKNKEHLLYHRRIRLLELSEYFHDISLSEFQELLSKLKDRSVSVNVLRKIKMSCVSSEFIEAVFKNNSAINYLLRIVTGTDPTRQLEAVACFTNLACSSHRNVYRIAKLAGVYFVSFITSSSSFLQGESIWAVANIANDCQQCFSLIKSQGALPALLQTLESPSSNVIQSAVYALNACTQYDDPEIISVIHSGIIKHLFSIMNHEIFDQSVFLDCAFTLSNCAYLSSKYTCDIFDSNSIDIIISILLKVIQDKEVDSLVAIPLVRCLGFLSNSDKVCEVISNHGEFLQCIQYISESKNIVLQKELIWLLTNLTASSCTLKASMCLPLIIDSLSSLLKEEGSSPSIQVLYFLSCLVSKYNSTLSILEQHEVSSQIQCLLSSKDDNIRHAAEILCHLTK